jgi:hypothetical protein
LVIHSASHFRQVRASTHVQYLLNWTDSDLILFLLAESDVPFQRVVLFCSTSSSGYLPGFQIEMDSPKLNAPLIVNPFSGLCLIAVLFNTRSSWNGALQLSMILVLSNYGSCSSDRDAHTG